MHATTLATLLVSFPLVLLNACTQTGETRSAATGETTRAAAVRTGATAIGDDWTSDAPGVRRLIRPSDLPQPRYAEGSDPERRARVR